MLYVCTVICIISFIAEMLDSKMQTWLDNYQEVKLSILQNINKEVM